MRSATRRRVSAFRRLLAHRRLAALLLAATLLVRLLVPGGYMIGVDHGRVSIELCSGITSAPMAMGAMAMHTGMGDHGRPKEHDRAEMPCAFAGLSAAALGAVDPVLLAVLLAFIVAITLRRTPPLAIIRRAYLRPPLRAPPSYP